MISSTLLIILNVAFVILLIHVILSWLINFQVLNLRQPMVYQVWDGLNKLLEPVFRPIRKVLPNTGALDFAPLVVFIGIIILQNIVARAAYSGF